MICANASIRKAVATSEPVAVSEFFHHISTAILEGLFATNSNDIGILGDLSNHFGVVEANGRGMLHLHSLLWVRGNTAFTTLRDRLTEDSTFAARMVHYLDSVIMHGVDETISRIFSAPCCACACPPLIAFTCPAQVRLSALLVLR